MYRAWPESSLPDRPPRHGRWCLPRTGRIENDEAGEALQQTFGNDGAAPVREHHVAHQGMQRSGVLRRQLLRGRSSGRLEDHVACLSQAADRHGPDMRIIFDNQDCFRVGRGPRVHRGWRLRNLALCGREIDREPRAHALLRLHYDVAALLLDDPVDGGKSQTAALAIFSGEERLENAVAHGGRHTTPGVRYGKQDVRTRNGSRMENGVVRVKDNGSRLDGQRATAGHGVAPVHRQVHEHLLELPGIDSDAARAFGQRERDSDVLAKQRPKELDGQPDPLVGVDYLRLNQLSAGEGQQLAGDVRRAFCGLIDCPQILVARMLLTAQLRVAQNRRECVVQVVRDSTREAAYSLELLAVKQLRLEGIALGRIDADAGNVRAIAHLKSLHVDRAWISRPIGAEVRGSDFDRGCLAGEQRPHGLAEPRSVCGGAKIKRCHSTQLFHRIAKVLTGSAVHIDEPPGLRVDDEDLVP